MVATKVKAKAGQAVADGKGALTLPRPIPEQLAEMIAARLRVIGEPLRIRILDMLRDGEMSVGEITQRLGTSQQNASKHLGILLQAGIVARRKEGSGSIYSIADRGVYELCEQVCGGLQLHLAELSELMRGVPPAGNRANN